MESSSNTDIIIEFSVFSKDYGILTKEMRLVDDVIIKDASQCWMSEGSVRTESVFNLAAFENRLRNSKNNEAIALGVAQGAKNRTLLIRTKKALESIADRDFISRTQDFFYFKAQPSLMLLDYDPEKGKPALTMDEVYSRLLEIVPEIKDCGVLAMGSTSSGIYKEEETPPEISTGGIHFYIIVNDGTKIPELGKIIASRSWLKGYGRFDISKSGALLQRNLFDEAVFSPERLIFEALPVLGAELKQLPRTYKYWPGKILQISDVRGLTTIEETEIEVLKTSAKAQKQAAADIIKGAHTKIEVAKLINTGVSRKIAIEQVENTHNGTLTGSYPLQFAGTQLISVIDVLRTPKKYHGWACKDPDESQEQSAPFRAIAYDNDTGVLIRSFRHGGINYRVKRSAIKIDIDHPIKMFGQIESVLNTGLLPDVLIWSGILIYIGSDGTLRNITAITAPIILGRLIKFYTMKEIKGQWNRVRSDLPDRLVKAFLEQGSWNVPKLEGVIHSPYFFDGDVIQTEGYNRKSGLYLTHGCDLSAPKNATRAQAEMALNFLREIINTFPFESPVDEAVTLAMILTAIQRVTLETAPLFGASANTPGTGKTILISGVASIGTGDAPAVHGYRDNEPETAKMLMSALLQGSSNIIIDNVKLGVALGGDSLCTLLTSPLYTDRELGFSRTRTVSTRVLMAATGNNLKIASDMTRRVLMIRLDAKCERPELRQFDKSFVQICREHHKPIVKSILTILSAYHEAGRPKVGHIRIGTFEAFSDAICAPLVWLGVVDPGLGLVNAESDEGIAGLAELLNIWNRAITCQRKTTAELMQCYVIKEYFSNEFEDRGGVTVKKVGRFLAKYAGRVVGGMRIVQDGTLHKVAVWKLEWVGG